MAPAPSGAAKKPSACRSMLVQCTIQISCKEGGTQEWCNKENGRQLWLLRRLSPLRCHQSTAHKPDPIIGSARIKYNHYCEEFDIVDGVLDFEEVSSVLVCLGYRYGNGIRVRVGSGLAGVYNWI